MQGTAARQGPDDNDDLALARDTLRELQATARRIEMLAAAGREGERLLAAAALRLTEAAQAVEDLIPRQAAVASIAAACAARRGHLRVLG